jgi:hypothetical protein
MVALLHGIHQPKVALRAEARLATDGKNTRHHTHGSFT